MNWIFKPSSVGSDGRIRYTLDLTIPAILAALVMAAAKLSGVVTWSWWVVTFPIWFPFLLAAGGIVLIGCVFVLAGITRQKIKWTIRK